MNPYLTEQMAIQRGTELREQAARQADRRHAHRARQARQASAASRGAALRPGRYGRSHPVRRRAGYALISIGLRLAYAAGDE